VAVNRSFHSAPKYDEYIAKAIEYSSMQTNSGNPKFLTPHIISNWILDWMLTRTREPIQNVFDITDENYLSKSTYITHMLYFRGQTEVFQELGFPGLLGSR
jgi:hypothetical protein